MNEAGKTFDIQQLKTKISKDLFSIISSEHMPDSTGKCNTAAFGKNLSGGFKT
jgi:hypothetical protein